MKNIKFNLDAFLWTLILSLYAYMITELILTDDILLFLHPKMLIYIYLALVFICILMIYQITKWFQNAPAHSIKKGYLIFLVPLILAFTVNPKDISVQMAENKGVYVMGEKGRESSQSDTLEGEAISITATSVETPYYISDFAGTMMDMYFNPENYEGRTVQVTGFLYKEEGFNPNSFLVARLLVTCCAADAQIAGIKCEWDQIESLNFDKWYQIEGKIKLTKVYNELLKGDEIITVIEVTQAFEVTEPDNPYIYP